MEKKVRQNIVAHSWYEETFNWSKVGKTKTNSIENGQILGIDKLVFHLFFLHYRSTNTVLSPPVCFRRFYFVPSLSLFYFLSHSLHPHLRFVELYHQFLCVNLNLCLYVSKCHRVCIHKRQANRHTYTHIVYNEQCQQQQNNRSRW